MLKKKLTAIGILFIVAMVLTACDSTADALLDYNNDFLMDTYLVKANEYVKIRDEYEKKVQETGNREELESFLVEKAVPKSEKLLDLVKQKSIDNEEVQDLHDILIESQERNDESLQKELASVRKDSGELFQEAESLAKKADDLQKKFLKELNEMKEEYNIEDQNE